MRAITLIRAFQVRGHMLAKVDPLGLHKPIDIPELHKEYYGFTDADWDKPIFVGCKCVRFVENAHGLSLPFVDVSRQIAKPFTTHSWLRGRLSTRRKANENVA